MVCFFPCFCAACMAEQYAECTQYLYAGHFRNRTMRKKDLRTPTARYMASTRVVMKARTRFVVKEIVGNRLFEGKQQYEVVWEGHQETTWMDADKLSCFDLIEAFTINEN